MLLPHLGSLPAVEGQGTGLRWPGKSNVMTLHNATLSLGLNCRQLFTFISGNSPKCLLEIKGQEFLHI